MEHFARIVNGFYALTIFTKRSILNVRQGSGYASVRLYNILIILSSSHIYKLNLFHLARLPFLDCRAKQTSYYLARHLFSSSVQLDNVDTANLPTTEAALSNCSSTVVESCDGYCYQCDGNQILDPCWLDCMFLFLCWRLLVLC